MDHAYAELNGIRLHYVTVGRGPLMLFVHGFPEFWYEWREQLREFGRDHQAVAPDMRGYNLSDKPAELPSIGCRRWSKICALSPRISVTRHSCSSVTTGAASSPGRSRSRIPSSSSG